MSGPHDLDTDTISRLVTKTSAGAYILSKDGQIAHYVGRSDDDVAERLEWWANNTQKYSHFWFEYTDSPKAAFDLECRWWHEYNPEDNQKHPDRPDSSNWQCPVCNIFRPGRW